MVARSYDYLDELYQAAAAVAEDDVSARRALAQRMLPRLPSSPRPNCTWRSCAPPMAQNLDPRTTTPRQLIEQLLPHMPTATWERPWLRSEFLHLLPHAALDTDREQLRELFLAANNADPEGWERERVRSQVLYPLDQPFQERPGTFRGRSQRHHGAPPCSPENRSMRRCSTSWIKLAWCPAPRPNRMPTSSTRM